MSAALDRLTNGYWNAGLKSGGNPGGMSGPGAARENWPLMLADIAAVIAEGALSATQAAAAASSALNAPGTSATSISDLTIPAAIPTDVAFAVQEAGKLFVPGQTLLIARPPPNAHMFFVGPLLTFDPVTKLGTMRALFAAGAGNFQSWNVTLSAPVDATLTGRVAALEVANAQQRSDALFFAKEFI